MKVGRLGAAVAVAVLLAMGVQGAVLYVDSDAGGSNNGNSWGDAYTNLQSALSAAVSNDQVWVGEGTYLPGAARTNTFSLKGGMALYGGFAGSETNLSQRDWTNHVATLSGEIGSSSATDNVYRVVSILDNRDNVVLDGFTIRDGYYASDTEGKGAGLYIYKADNAQVRHCIFQDNYARYSGGGLYFYPRSNFTSPLTVSDCVFVSNRSDRAGNSYGGGIGLWRGVVTVVRCWFEGNSSACNGGGLMAYSQTTLTLRESDFEGNEAQYGGGAYVWSDERGLTVEDCAFAGNAASYYGGGLYLRNAPATGRVERCAFLGNLAERDGGGAYNLSGNLFFINCLFSGNQAEGTGGTGGGALVNYSGANPRLMHCTFAGNEGKNGGGMAGLGSGGVNAGLTNCVFWGNLATNYGSQIYQNVTGTLRIAYSDIEDGTNGIYLTGNAALSQGSGVITNDPLFMDPAGEDGIAGTWDDDLHLGWGSPCVDSGTANGAPAVDLENVSRPQMNGYDMGALEREADADHDDLPDTWEMEHFGDFDETGTGDADSDGLSNLGEYEHGTDPLDWDSDGDQASDGDEVAAGTDPLNPAEFPDSDADGLPDPWETLHFGSLSQTGASDPDEDGFCNGYEYRYGSDPTSGASIPTGANPDWGQSSRLVGRQPHAALHQLGHGGDQHSGGAHRGHGRLRPHRGG